MIPLIKSRIAELEKGCGQMYNDEIPDDDGIPSEFEVGCLKYSLCSLCQAKISAWKEFLILAEEENKKEYDRWSRLLNEINDDLDLDLVNGEEGYKTYESSYNAIKKYTLKFIEETYKEVFGGQT